MSPRNDRRSDGARLPATLPVRELWASVTSCRPLLDARARSSAGGGQVETLKERYGREVLDRLVAARELEAQAAAELEQFRQWTAPLPCDIPDERRRRIEELFPPAKVMSPFDEEWWVVEPRIRSCQQEAQKLRAQAREMQVGTRDLVVVEAILQAFLRREASALVFLAGNPTDQLLRWIDRQSTSCPCGQRFFPLASLTGGRRRTFCSNACRQACWRRRTAAARAT